MHAGSLNRSSVTRKGRDMTNNEAFVRLDDTIKNDAVLSQLHLIPVLDRSHCGDIYAPINIASNVYITKDEVFVICDEKLLTRILRDRTLTALRNIKKLVDDDIDRLEA